MLLSGKSHFFVDVDYAGGALMQQAQGKPKGWSQ